MLNKLQPHAQSPKVVLDLVIAENAPSIKHVLIEYNDHFREILIPM